jgi:hypothetical protein
MTAYSLAIQADVRKRMSCHPQGLAKPKKKTSSFMSNNV